MLGHMTVVMFVHTVRIAPYVDNDTLVVNVSGHLIVVLCYCFGWSTQMWHCIGLLDVSRASRCARGWSPTAAGVYQQLGLPMEGECTEYDETGHTH